MSLSQSWTFFAAVLVWSSACGPAGGTSSPSAAADVASDMGARVPTADADAAEFDAAPADATPSTASDAGPPPLCVAGTPTKTGVGKACAKPEDCWGQSAVTCADDIGPGAPKMCVQYCFGFPGECGESLCLQRPGLPAICVPPGCAALFTVAMPTQTTCTDDCTVPPSPLGVGKPCTTHADCAGQIAFSCPYVYKPDNQKWCSLLCSQDDDCGPEAVCWRRAVIDNGVQLTIGSCTPKACCTLP